MCRDVSLTSQIRADVRMKIGHSVLAKYREASKVISLQGLFDDYWNSEDYNLTVLGWSLLPTVPAYLLTENGRASCRWKT